MKKKICIIHSVLSCIFILMLYIPTCVRNTGYTSIDGSFHASGYNLSYGGYMDEFGWIAVGSIIVLVASAFTKFYYLTIAPAVINLFVIVFKYNDVQGISNVHISEDFVVILIIIIAICILLNSIWAIIDYLLLKNNSPKTIVMQKTSQSNADELKKFKELLDSGIITQEEFDEKKKQLLNL